MGNLEDVIIKIRNYKSFGATEHGYEGIRSINLIIGRNNTGKSTLLDLIDYATEPRDLCSLGHRGQQPEVIITNTLNEEELRRVFREDVGGGDIMGNHWAFGSRWIERPITWSLDENGRSRFLALDPPLDIMNAGNYSQALAEQNSFFNPHRTGRVSISLLCEWERFTERMFK